MKVKITVIDGEKTYNHEAQVPPMTEHQLRLFQEAITAPTDLAHILIGMAQIGLDFATKRICAARVKANEQNVDLQTK